MDREAQRIADLLEPSLDAMGYDLVRVTLRASPPGSVRRKRPGEAPGRILQIMAERGDRVPMSGADCADVSRAAAAILDVEDPIAGAYVLEVSSPGIDRPLVTAAHFARFAGHEARIDLSRAVDGRKRFRGILAGVDGETVRLVIDGAGCAVPIADIQRARLVLTDALIRAGQDAARAAAPVDDEEGDDEEGGDGVDAPVSVRSDGEPVAADGD